MGVLYDQLAAKLLPGMSIPEPIRKLYDWIEAHGYFVEQASGARIGFLFPEAELRAGWTDSERPGGTIIEIAGSGNSGLEHWFGHDDPKVLNRLCVFAQTGAEGSMAAFWLNEDGTQKIVHLGSGSGSTLVCILASDAVDFLRLLAIGYDEICWNSEFPTPPNEGGELLVQPNKPFQDWVATSFDVSIPQTAVEIVKHPNEIGDENPEDEFARWVDSNIK